MSPSIVGPAVLAVWRLAGRSPAHTASALDGALLCEVPGQASSPPYDEDVALLQSQRADARARIREGLRCH